MKITDCDCLTAGRCARHGTFKTDFQWEMCQRRTDWFARWEAGQMAPVPEPSLPIRSACRHCGSEVRRTTCTSCCGHVELKVFACELHQECTPGRIIEGLSCCLICLDFEATDPPITSAI